MLVSARRAFASKTVKTICAVDGSWDVWLCMASIKSHLTTTFTHNVYNSACANIDIVDAKLPLCISLMSLLHSFNCMCSILPHRMMRINGTPLMNRARFGSTLHDESCINEKIFNSVETSHSACARAAERRVQIVHSTWTHRSHISFHTWAKCTRLIMESSVG